MQSPTTNNNDENMIDIKNAESDIEPYVSMFNVKQKCMFNVKQKCKSCINDCMYKDYYNCLDSYGFVALDPLQRFPQLNSQSISKMGYVGLHSLLADSRTPNCIGSQLVVPSGFESSIMGIQTKGLLGSPAHILP